jgi:geranylgeranyl diphosphate synthase type II
MRAADELRDAFEAFLGALPLAEELGELEGVVRYALEPGGKRIRPALCLAVAESAGGDVDEALPAAASIELVHTFSLVHDDLPALDDDAVRRGRPSVHAAFGEGVAVLAGDALLAEAFRLVLSYELPDLARELVEATLGMIGGQHLDITGADADLERLHRLKTGRLFSAAVGLGLWTARVAPDEQSPWRAFADELGLLFQVVDDILDDDGYAKRLGVVGAQRLAGETADRARERLVAVPADTSVLGGFVDRLAATVRG